MPLPVEAIEQFNLRIITIDNVGVDDGRYPFSQPLHYIYRAQPSEKVQGFLDFLKTPDAQSAIEFAQSQPADPTREFIEPSLNLLKTAVAPTSTSQNCGCPSIRHDSRDSLRAKPQSPRRHHRSLQ